MNGIIVVPIYNEEENLCFVINELTAHFSNDDLLFIDDGSQDGSHKILKERKVNYLQHPVNLGYEETLKTGMHHALQNNCEFVVFFDSDGQHHVKDLMKIIACYEKDKFDFILGSRYQEKNGQQKSLRFLGTKLFSWLASMLSGFKITDATCGLKLISKKFIPQALQLQSEDMHAELIVGLAQSGARLHEEGIAIYPRKGGESMHHSYRALFYPAKSFLCLMEVFVSMTVRNFLQKCWWPKTENYQFKRR